MVGSLDYLYLIVGFADGELSVFQLIIRIFAVKKCCLIRFLLKKMYYKLLFKYYYFILRKKA